MGHAGAIVSGSSGTAAAKKEALEAVGVKVGKTPSETAELMREILQGTLSPLSTSIDELVLLGGPADRPTVESVRAVPLAVLVGQQHGGADPGDVVDGQTGVEPVHFGARSSASIQANDWSPT